MRPAILIHGPTASGKTDLAIALANRLGGEIVNADSMQVYSDLRILSARPSDKELEKAPHRMFGHIDAGVRYSTGHWLKEAKSHLAAIQRQDKTAIFVGGTGLYLLTLIQGLSEIPPVPEEIRADVRAIRQEEGVQGIYQRLQQADPDMAASLKPGDRQRVGRAYEVWLATGQSLASFQSKRSEPHLGRGEWLGIALTPPRSRLYARIDKRFEGMLMTGAMAEAEALVARDLDPELPIMKAHGMPWLIAFIRNEISAEFAAENAKRDTRRYAKRQFTWIGRQFPYWPRIPSTELNARLRVVSALYREIDAA